jgi:predicted enzyme related to lactoylglutathione lyase
MPVPDATRLGAPCWVDLFSSDTDASRAFYEGLFGWTSVSAGEEFGGYINFSKGDAMVAGCMRNDGTNGTPDGWSIYLSTKDAQATTDSATAGGGGVIVPPMAVGELGSMAVLTDAGGAVIGAWQPGLHEGFGIVAEPGAPAWFELHTRDYEAAIAFYRDVFGWDTHAMSDTPEFRYTTLYADEAAAAGIMDATNFLPDGVPAHWSVYFGVDDADATATKAAELGGTLVQGIDDTPFGRLATFADPTGALFKIVQSPQG